MKYVMQDLEWFKKNAYEDSEGDFWLNEADKDKYEEHKRDIEDTDELVFKDDIGEVLSKNQCPLELFHWGIKLTLTPESHPEYFL